MIMRDINWRFGNKGIGDLEVGDSIFAIFCSNILHLEHEKEVTQQWI